MNVTADDQFRAMAHSVRLRILALMTARPLSASEVAATTGIAHASASYHLRRLAAAGLITLVADAPVSAARGGVGRPPVRYRLDTAIPNIGAQAAPPVYHTLIAEIGRRLTAGPTVGGTVTDAEVWLSAEDQLRVAALIEQAAVIVHERAQPPRSPDSVHVGFTALLLKLEA